MLKTQELIERLDLIDREKYKDMLSQVNIPDFYKCIAQFSGLNITNVSDDAIFNYLKSWCENKYRFFLMLGNKTRLDQPLKYKRQDKNASNEFNALSKQFPAYFFWIKNFNHADKNKIDTNNFSYSFRESLTELFPNYNLSGSTITHFFKSKLSAPDELVTAIGRIFENDTIEATHTISIDPIDMMLASENPYKWSSCYRLELDRGDSHADGCLAAILDTTSLITYVWDKEGEFGLYDKFKFKNIRYYRMRGWIAISQDFNAIHFNSVYPGRTNYDEEFNKQLRGVVEEVVAKYMKVKNLWRANGYATVKGSGCSDWTYHKSEFTCDRYNYYGYNEYEDSRIYVNSEMSPALDKEKVHESFDSIEIPVYDTKIICPCGCGSMLCPSGDTVDEDYDEGLCYNGEGFRCDNFYQNEPEYKWCEYRDCLCTCGCLEGECCDEECEVYQDNNPLCSLDEHYECEDPDWDEVRHGIMSACESNCEHCWRWKQHHHQTEE